MNTTPAQANAVCRFGFALVILCGPRLFAQDQTTADTPLPEGVTPALVRSIEKGLAFLGSTQASDGSWTATEDAYPVAMTALAGTALLASGSTSTRGPHQEAIRKATEYLLKSQDKSHEQLFAVDYVPRSNCAEERPMFGHAFAMMFLAQVLGGEESLERQAEIRRALRKAVDLTDRAQTDDGGWYYEPDSRRDEGTLTVTMMQGLRACRDAGIHVPKKLIDDGVKYIEASVNENGSVNYTATGRGRWEVREGVTCASVVALWSAGRYEDKLLKRIVNYMDRNINPQWGSYTAHATYVQYYLGQAKFLLGGDRWTKFYREEARLLQGKQYPDGSWITGEESRHGVGPVYATSVALIVLQLPFNRLPVYQR